MWRLLLALLLFVIGTRADDVSTIEVDISIPEETQITNFTECEKFHDTLLEWPTTKRGELVHLRCPVLDGYPNPQAFATRKCHTNGTWDTKASYSKCIEEIKLTHQNNEGMMKEQQNQSYIFLAGHILSDVSMIAAICIFFKYKRLRCLRNRIHCNLLAALICKHLSWYALYGIAFNTSSDRGYRIECKVVLIINKIFKLAQYSWMFIEGLYLFLVVVRGQLNSVMELKHYIAIGWGFPLVIATGWVVIIAVTYIPEDDARSTCWTTDHAQFAPERLLESVSVYLLLAINLVIMVSVVVTLVNKLKQSSMDQHKQHIKTVKATLLLLILLGGLYILLTIDPDIRASWIAGVSYTIAVVQSTQGFAVALIYCFLNGEVQSCLKKSLDQWKDERTLPSGLSQWLQKRRRSSGATIQHRDSTVVETLSNSRRNSKQTSSEHIDINSNTPLQLPSKPPSSLALV